MRGFLAKLCKKNGIAKRIVSMSLALLMVLSTLQVLPVGILVANAAESAYAVTDLLQVKVGDKVYPMGTYKSGVYEAVVDVDAAGTYTGTLMQNGAVTTKVAEVTTSGAGKVYFRLNGNEISAGNVGTAALVGDLDVAFGGNYANWDPKSTASELTYLGGGLWYGTVEFAALATDTNLKYKVAMNDDWAVSYGEGGKDIVVKVPSGSTSFTVLCDTISGVVFDDVRTDDFTVVQNGDKEDLQKNAYTTAVSLIGPARESNVDWNTGVTDYDFTPISNTLYRYEKTFATAGTYTYKVVFDHAGVWYEKESDDQALKTTVANTHVVFLYDTVSGYLYDTVNDADTVNALLTGSSLPTYDVTIHFYNSEAWTDINAYSYYGNPEVRPNGGWPGTSIKANAVEGKEGWYNVTYTDLPTSSFNVIFNNNPGNKETASLQVSLSKDTKELWAFGGVKETSNPGKIVTSAPEEWTNPPAGGPTQTTPFEGTVTLHYKNENAWDVVNAWVWDDAQNYTGGNWPGKVCTLNEKNAGAWYDITVDLKLVDSKVKMIFSNITEGMKEENKVQTADIEVKIAEGTKELWITGGKGATKDTVTSTAPAGWVSSVVKKSLKINYYKADDTWTEVAAYVWDKDENKPAGAWPGTKATKELADNAKDKWYTVTVSDIEADDINVIMNNNDNGKQDEKIPVTLSKTNNEIWIKDGAIIKSPIVNGNKVTFNYIDESREATSLKLTGSAWSWGDEGPEMTKVNDSNVFTLELTMAPGQYTYKFNPGGGSDSWFADPLNGNSADDGFGKLNSVLIVSGLTTTPMEVKKGADFVLPASLKYVDSTGKETPKDVTWALKNDEDASFATVAEGNTLKTVAGCEETTVDLVATATDDSGETVTVTVKLVDKLYTYTVYAYSPIASKMSVDKSALWIWDKAGETSLKDAEYEFTETEELADGRTWLKAEIKLSCAKSIGFILKNKGKDIWDWQTADLLFSNKEETDQTLYLFDGYDKVYTSLDELPTISQLCIEYTRNDSTYKTPYVEVWGDGFDVKENSTYNFDNASGKYIVNVPVALGEKDRTVSFKVYNNGKVDGDVNSVTIKAGEKLTKVKFANGAITNVVPDSSSYVVDRNNNKISFYYRDEALFLENKMHTIDDVKLAIRKAVGNAAVTAETRIDMTYDSNDERFELEGQELPNDSDVYYYFVVDDEVVLDVKNDRRATIDGTEYCMVRNRVYNINLSASVKYSDMTYDDGNVLYVKFDKVEGFNPETVTADLSALGLGNKVAVDKELMALSFGCLEGTSVGTKTIKITLKDDCDVTYTATATVNVKARTKTANTDSKLGTFDWDEAVIYFAITDRFFDGNAKNNTGDPNSTADDVAYNPDDMGSYHGGDFAGLTQKMDYLYDLGVNTIWLTPIVDNVDINCDNGTADCDYYAYHGYWASDFTKLNPHLGTEAEFKALVDAAHAKGMKIMVDVVVNHAGYGSEADFAGLIRSAEDTVVGDTILDGLSGLPDFATEDPEVRKQLIEWQTGWMTAYDIDYYRVDTVKHVENTTWNAFKNALVEKNQDFKLIGEYYDATYSNDNEQLDTGRMDSILDFSFNDIMFKLVDEDLAGIENTLGERNTMLTNTATVGSFTSSHDEDGLLYRISQKEDAEWAKALMKVAATYQATAKGQPVIYYGEEIGMTGQNNWPYYTNRLDFDWEEQVEQAADENSMFNHYKKVLNIRRDYSEVFAKGTRTAIASGDGYEIFARSYEDEKVYVAVNVWGDDAKAKFYVPGATGSVYTDLYSGKTYTVAADGSITVTIPGAAKGGTAILVGTGIEIEDTNEITVVFHYTRDDGKYDGWQLYAWTESGLAGTFYKFADEGNSKVATVSKIPGRSTTRLCYLTSLNEWEAKDYGEDQYLDLSDIVSGTVHYYINSAKTGGTRVLGADAIIGSKIVKTSYNRNTNVVTVNMSTPITGSALEAFEIMCTSTDSKIDIESVEKNGNQYFLTLKQDISSLESLLLSYTITYDGYTYNLMTPNVYSSKEFEDAYAYTGKDLGLTYTKEASTFKLWAPTADSVTLNVYSGGTAGTADKLGSYTMTGGTKADKGVWTYVLDGDWNGKYYTYTVNVANKVNEACDPYARTTGVNGKRAMILDLASTNPEGWDADKNAVRHKGMEYTDAVIYELHVRDLTSDSSSGVDSKYQGKFMGLTQTGTTTAGGNPTALDHMVNLGITHLHLIPVYDYGSVDETKLDTPQFNWGYDPVNYNVPEGSYSTNPYDGSVRVAEMKQMIKTLHENNINVVMDVVYNHVYDAETFAFNQVVPKYFSRTKEDGTYSSRSGCGNDTASERAMVHKYIVDSILYWHNEYHIDGFRFDLVGLIDTVTINKLVADVHAIDPDIIFYGEGWAMDDTAMTKDGYDLAKQSNSSKTPGFAYFSDTIRNGIAGSDVDGKGYIWGEAGKDALVSGLTLAQSSWTTNPSQTINYVSCHDNYTLMDKINVVSKAGVTNHNYTPGEYQVALNNLAAASYMFSEGIPLIHAGEDFLRIKIDEKGTVIHNSYNSPDYVNKIRWSNLDKDIYADTTDYYKGLIEFRKNHAVLRLADAASVSANVTSAVHSTGVIVNTFKGGVNGEVSDGIVTIFNATNKAVTISGKYGITNGTEWKVCVNKEDAGTDVLATITNGSVTVEPYSVMALVKGETVDTNSIYDKNNSVTLTLSEDAIETGIGGVVALSATTNTPATVTWVSSDETVATVDELGRVTAVATGTATITASTYHGVEATCEVTVTNETVEKSITIDKTELSLVAGESETLVITVSPAGTAATYASSDEAVATIDSTGKVTALAAGTATVTATLANGQSVSCTVTVEAAPVEETVTLNKTTLSLAEGTSEILTATVTPEGTKVSFSSKDTTVATVDANGKVTAVAEGETEIVVATAAGKTAICTVTVTKANPVVPTPTPTPGTGGATGGSSSGATAGATLVTPPATKPDTTKEDTKTETKVEVETETKAETTVPENVTDITPVVDEKLQNAIANEAEKIIEDILNDELADDVMSEETLENVKEAQENGEGIITEVIVDKMDESKVDADVKEALEKALTESVKDKKGAETKIAQYLDLTVLLKTTKGQRLGEINKLSKEMTFTIAVPEDLVKEGRAFVVLRMHEGETTVLETTMNSDGTLSFKTDRFSTYALAYVDMPVEEVEDEDGAESDVPSGSTTTEEEGGNNVATFIIIGLIIVIIAALVIIFLAMKRKKD